MKLLSKRKVEMNREYHCIVHIVRLFFLARYFYCFVLRFYECTMLSIK